MTWLDWYNGLVKPSWTPAPGTIGLIWQILNPIILEVTSFGRLVKNAGAVKPEEVNGVGFLLSDKKAGSLKIEVEWIKVGTGRSDELIPLSFPEHRSPRSEERPISRWNLRNLRRS